MNSLCKDPSHTWTVETKSHILTPALDLIPGRRCTCGSQIILTPPGDCFLPGILLVAPIDSPAAKRLADLYPALKTW